MRTGKKPYVMYPLRYGVSLMTSSMGLVLAVTMVILSKPVETVAFLAIFAAFLHEIALYGRRITVNDEGISMASIFNRRLISLSWDEIGEIGVSGTKLFPRNDKGRRGSLFIYVSDKEMTEDQRFDMMLRFPPKDKIVYAYDSDRLAAVQVYYSAKIRKFNTGSAKLLSDMVDESE